jgi:hypothetical protein
VPFDSSRQDQWLISQWLSDFKPSWTPGGKQLLLNGFQQVKIRDPLTLHYPQYVNPDEGIRIEEDLLSARRRIQFTNNSGGRRDDGDDDLGGPIRTGGGPGSGTTSNGVPSSGSTPDSGPSSSESSESGDISEVTGTFGTPPSPGSSYSYVSGLNSWIAPIGSCSGGDVGLCLLLARGPLGVGEDRNGEVLGCLISGACGFESCEDKGGIQFCACCLWQQDCFDCCDTATTPEMRDFCNGLAFIICCYENGVIDVVPTECCFGGGGG